jgi:hypothetical protein
MKIGNIVLISIFFTALTGCSSKPDITDIEPQLRSAWAACSGVKLTGLKKLNLVPKANGYKMPVSFNLELSKDLGGCSGIMANLLYSAALKNGLQARTGEVISVTATYNMIESENGWISQ